MNTADWIIAGITILAFIPFMVVILFGGYCVVDDMAREIHERMRSWKDDNQKQY